MESVPVTSAEVCWAAATLTQQDLFHPPPIIVQILVMLCVDSHNLTRSRGLPKQRCREELAEAVEGLRECRSSDLEKEVGSLVGSEGVAIASVLCKELGVLILFGIFLRAHEEHVLQ